MNDRTKDYLFVSYSHKDEIKDVLNDFDKHSYNLVFDESLQYGDEWDLSVRRQISSPKCKGVVLMISKNSLVSKAVLAELEMCEKYKKKFLPILLEDRALNNIFEDLTDRVDENKGYILSCQREILSNENLYAFKDSLNWDKIDNTLKNWGVEKEIHSDFNIVEPKYTSDLIGEKERLERQQGVYYSFDMQAINTVLETFTRDGLLVLDLGCANGSLTISRFGDIEKVKRVIGVDYNERDIEQARENAQKYGDKFAFYTLDLEAPDIEDRLMEIIKENGFDSADIVFSSLVLHHLKKPKKLLLKLYDIFSDDGKIILRGSDDGGKLCHPGNELMLEIFERYSKIVQGSDRTNGRKLYGQLYDTGYIDIKMLYMVNDTCERDRKNKDGFYKVGFEFRLKRLDALVESNPGNEFLKSERDWMADALGRFKEMFYERNFWYCLTSYIAIAGVR